MKILHSQAFRTNPFLLVGTMRSGTTMLNRALNLHPDLTVPYASTDFCSQFLENLPNVPAEMDLKAWSSEAVTYMQRARPKVKWDQTTADKLLDYLKSFGKALAPADMYSSLTRVFMEKDTARRWGDKYTGTGIVPAFYRLFPAGQVIHIVRDLRDVYASNKGRIQDGSSRAYLYGDHLRIVEDWIASVVDGWANLSYYGKKQYLKIRYEDLCQEPNQTMRLVTDFLGVDYSEELVSMSSAVNDVGESWLSNSSFNMSVQGMTTQAIGRYKTYLGPGEVLMLQAVARGEMLRENYQFHVYEPNGASVKEAVLLFDWYIAYLEKELPEAYKRYAAMDSQLRRYEFLSDIAKQIYQEAFNPFLQGLEVGRLLYQDDPKPAWPPTVSGHIAAPVSPPRLNCRLSGVSSLLTKLLKTIRIGVRK